MFCVKCGCELPEGARFCTKCGNPIGPEAASAHPGETPDIAAIEPALPVSAADPANASSAHRSGLIIVTSAACALALVAVVAYLVLVNPLNLTLPGTASSGTSESGATADTSEPGTLSVDGTTVEMIHRPAIAHLASDETDAVAAPALADYVSSGTASTGSVIASRRSSSGGSTSDGGTSSGGSSSGGASSGSSSSADSSSTVGGLPSGGTQSDSGITYSDLGNIEVANRYGTLSELKPTSGLGNVVNLSDFHLNASQKSLLEKNMFAVTESSDCEFFDVYESNRYNNLASFVTVDSMMHTYHLYFSHLLKNTEKNYLSGTMSTVSTAMLEASEKQLEVLAGTEWEEAATRNVTFFSVGCRLLDSGAQTPAIVESAVQDELSKIADASTVAVCAITGEREDYSQYKPRGYYEGDEQLEKYFRAMMWYGRINFTQNNESLDRSALLLTLALDGGSGGTANSDWESAYAITSFFAGASDDLSYYECYPLFAYSYGEGATVDKLAGNADAWETYHGLTAQLPAPQISSLVVGDETDSAADETKGLRFMGQRFSLDESTFEQLTYDRVGTKENPRLLPSALDLPAALGSETALAILEDEGETSYESYDSQMEAVRTSVSNSDDTLWTASLYSQWLYTLNPLIVSAGEGYPTFMQSVEWDKKNLQSYLGSYTELKHDTVLYSKQTVAEAGGGVEKKDDRGYVEPQPDLYGRLANLVQATSDGLSSYGMISSDDVDNLAKLKEMATEFQTISENELSGETLTDDEYDFIRTYGVSLEHFWETVNSSDGAAPKGGMTRSAQYPAAVVVDIATNASDGSVLENATGRVSYIYVLVPIDGELHLCQGATYSYYEFEQDQSNRLTDSEWRDMLGITRNGSTTTPMPDKPLWTQTFQSTK